MLKAVRQPWNRLLLSAILYIVCGFVLITLPFFTPLYFQSQVTKIFIFTIFAMSLNLLWGYTGLISLGHAAYFGVGAYATGILILRCGVESFWLAAPAGIFMAVLVAAIFGLIALRVSHVYFLLVTFALGELLFHIAEKWTSVTGGSNGLSGIPPPDLGLPWLTGNPYFSYYFIFAGLVICFLIIGQIVSSPFGRHLKGIRENEVRMQCLGFNTWPHKYLAFILGGLFAGVAGVLYAYSYGLVAPANIGIQMSGLVLFMVIIGGSGMLFGPLIGAGVVLFLQYFSSMYTPERWPLILGATFVVAAIYFHRGIGIYLLSLWKRVMYRYGIT